MTVITEHHSVSNNNSDDTINETTSLLLVPSSLSAIESGTSTTNNNSNSNSNNNSNQSLQRARRLLYISHFMSQFTQQMYEFTLLLLLAAITNYQSVVYVSSYGIVSGIVICLFTTTLSRYFIDHPKLEWSSNILLSSRLASVQFLICVQNMCVILTTIVLYIILRQEHGQSTTTSVYYNVEDNNNNRTSIHHNIDVDSEPTQDTNGSISASTFIICMILIHIFGPLSSLLDKTLLVIIERDWVVVMNEYYSKCKESAEREALPDSVDNLASTNGNNNGVTASSKRPQLSKNAPTSTTSIWLSETNVTMKQIDLSCKIAAPAIAGLLMGILQTFVVMQNKDNGTHTISTSTTSTTSTAKDGMAITVIVVGILNGISLIVEYICSGKIYHSIPSLSSKNTSVPSSSSAHEHKHAITSKAEPFSKVNCKTSDLPTSINETQNRAQRNWVSNLSCCTSPIKTTRAHQEFQSSTSGMSIYFSQRISYAGISLSLLYFNTMTFGSLMTSYLLWRGMSVETVGFWRGVSSALGLAGTFAFRELTKKYSLITTGMIGITHQLICIAITIISFFVASYDLSMTFLIFGVCASRIGLWVFDVAVTQLMQQLIPNGIRGTVGGMQQSLNAFFQLSSFGLGFLLPSPHQFSIYAFIGWTSVAIAALIYSAFIFLRKSEFVALLTVSV